MYHVHDTHRGFGLICTYVVYTGSLSPNNRVKDTASGRRPPVPRSRAGRQAHDTPKSPSAST